jgi:hypothetical protein
MLLSAFILVDLCCLHEYHVVLFFKLFPEVLLYASIIRAWDIIVLVFIDIYDLVLHFFGEKIQEFVCYLRVVALGGLDSNLQLFLVEHELGLGWIDSGIFQ